MSFLWTRDELIAATGGRFTGAAEGITGISIDTRSIQPGELFVALAGENRDGHAFVADALAKGAGAALVSHVPKGVSDAAPLLIVEDTLAGLEALGRAGRARSEAKVIAVTGSVGKTSTKEMLRVMLRGQGRVHAAEKSFNNHWGVPITLARMPRETEIAVIEIGMNHPGEITPLSRMAAPDVAIITTIEAVHLAAFDGIEQIADAKAEIFAGLSPEGVALLNKDNPQFDRLAEQATGRVVTFGTDADLRLTKAEIRGDCTIIQADITGQRVTFKLGIAGRHFALNALAALGAVQAIGRDIAVAGLALASWAPPDGRGRRETILLGPEGVDGEVILIDESYNANPASMRAALAVLAAADVTDGIGRVARGRRIAFLGDMLELGPNEKGFHADLAALPELAKIDRVHTCGPLMEELHRALPKEKRGVWVGSSAELAAQVRRRLDAGDVCMVKGSLGSAMARVVEAVRALGVVQSSQEN
ncbi:UDP-N-acetylmuramoylalanyl-D-glutamyl-2,6-diaminopimelate--D-alanyl-D-alanine ligase [Rhodobacteraceae bacterium NNCM2]|nr:UDP-N-acetylmuramoylalanyl-D-glutamyl-2,6-diaminopimelate--D-alanyl-D-alanine ligase [Coraliihabitans acroporae]